MEIARLTDARSARVRSVHRLATRAGRRRSGFFLAEGPSTADEAVRAGAVRDLYVSAAAADRHADLVARARGAGVAVWLCTDEVLAAMADTVTPQGVLAVTRAEPVDLAAIVAARPATVAVLADIRDPGNAGTVIRAADATGTGAVVFTSGSVDPYNPKCVRATTGSLFHLAIATGVELSDGLAHLRADGRMVLAADGAGDVDLDDLLDLAATGDGPLPGPVAWVFGNEAWGLTDAGRDAADLVVRVPLHGRAESLNLAMAATVCLYASARAHRRRRP